MVTSTSQEPQHGVQTPPGESGCVYIIFIQASIMQVAWLVSRWKLHCTTRSVFGTIEWNVKEGSGHWTNGTDCRVPLLLGHSGQSHFPWRCCSCSQEWCKRGLGMRDDGRMHCRIGLRILEFKSSWVSLILMIIVLYTSGLRIHLSILFENMVILTWL